MPEAQTAAATQPYVTKPGTTYVSGAANASAANNNGTFSSFGATANSVVTIPAGLPLQTELQFIADNPTYTLQARFTSPEVCRYAGGSTTAGGALSFAAGNGGYSVRIKKIGTNVWSTISAAGGGVTSS